MGNSKRKPDEEWSQENLGDQLFDSYEGDVAAASEIAEVEDMELAVVADSAPVEVVDASADLSAVPASEAASSEDLGIEQNPAVLDLDFAENIEPQFDTSESVNGTMQLDLPQDVLSESEASAPANEFSGEIAHSSVELIALSERLDINDALPEKNLGEVVASGSMDFGKDDFLLSGVSEAVAEGSEKLSFEGSPLEEEASEQIDPPFESEGSQFKDSAFDELSNTVFDVDAPEEDALEATTVAAVVASSQIVSQAAQEANEQVFEPATDSVSGEIGVSEPSIQDLNYDWRKFIGMRSAPQGTPQELLTKAFASDTEKHLALQVVSLLSGERDELHNWKYAIWRDGNLRTYSHDGRSRVIEKITDEILRTDLRSAVFSLAPLLIQLHDTSFDFVDFMKERKVSSRKIQSLRKPLAWDGAELSMFGFGAYAKRLQNRSYRAFQFDGLGETIFYDGRSRCIYFDLNFYLTKPTSWLLYGVLTKLWALRMGYLPFVSLDVMNQMIPSIEKIKKEMGGKKSWLPFGQSLISKFLKSQYGKKVEMYTGQIQAIQTDQMFALTNAMNLHIYKLLLADGVDLVGLLSYILKTDVATQADGLSLLQTQQNRQEVAALFEFASTLSFLS